MGAFGRRYDFMHSPGEATFRQVRIEHSEAEGQDTAPAFADGKKPPQFMHCDSAHRRYRKFI